METREIAGYIPLSPPKKTQKYLRLGITEKNWTTYVNRWEGVAQSYWNLGNIIVNFNTFSHPPAGEAGWMSVTLADWLSCDPIIVATIPFHLALRLHDWDCLGRWPKWSYPAHCSLLQQLHVNPIHGPKYINPDKINFILGLIWKR